MKIVSDAVSNMQDSSSPLPFYQSIGNVAQNCQVFEYLPCDDVLTVGLSGIEEVLSVYNHSKISEGNDRTNHVEVTTADMDKLLAFLPIFEDEQGDGNWAHNLESGRIVAILRRIQVIRGEWRVVSDE